MQQMSLSFAVAAASLATEMFVPVGRSANAQQMIHGLHLAFLLLGGWTILSTLTFTALEERDGEAVSRHRVTRP
jgi:hypothetical protein